jgi:putative transposase
MLARVILPPSVLHRAHLRVWQRRFYDMNIWGMKKRDEKLNYMHNNPVKRVLVKEPGDWPWSSWRFNFLNDASLLAMDAVP